MARRMTAETSRRSNAEAKLKALDKLAGVWEASDPSGNDAVEGHVVFEWMIGRRFMIQQVNLDGTKGLEIIGYDEASDTLRSHYFDSSGEILNYRYEFDGDRITVAIDMKGRKGRFTGTFAGDGNSYAGRWAWAHDGEELQFDARMTRVDETGLHDGHGDGRGKR